MLCRLLEDPCGQDRAFAARSLLRLDPGALDLALPVLIELAKSADMDEWQRGVRFLHEIGPDAT